MINVYDAAAHNATKLGLIIYDKKLRHTHFLFFSMTGRFVCVPCK